MTPVSVLVPAAGGPALGPLAAPAIRFQPWSPGLVAPWNVDALSHGTDAKFDAGVAFGVRSVILRVLLRVQAQGRDPRLRTSRPCLLRPKGLEPQTSASGGPLPRAARSCR